MTNDQNNDIGRYNMGDNAGASPDNAAIAAFKESIPEAFRDKPYMQDVNSMESLVTKLDGAEVLIGKTGRVIIPGENATEEERSSFFRSIGRPETPDKYESPFEKESPVFEKMRDSFFKNGMTTAQAKNVMRDADAIIQEATSQQQTDIATQDTEFSTMMGSMFGDRKDAAIKNANNMINKFAPESVRSHLNDLGNKELLLLTSVLDKVHQKYLKEDNSVFETHGQETSNNIAEMGQQVDDLIAKSQDEKTYSSAQRIEFSRRANELQEQLTKAQGGK